MYDGPECNNCGERNIHSNHVCGAVGTWPEEGDCEMTDETKERSDREVVSQLTKLRKIAEAATPGPWKEDYCGDIWSIKVPAPIHPRIGTTSFYVEDHPDARFIAAFNPKVCLAILDRLERLERVAEAARGLDWSKLHTKSMNLLHGLGELDRALEALDGE